MLNVLCMDYCIIKKKRLERLKQQRICTANMTVYVRYSMGVKIWQPHLRNKLNVN